MFCVALWVLGCKGASEPLGDSGVADVQVRDVGADQGPEDAGRTDGADVGAPDSGPGDTGVLDTGEVDAGAFDMGMDAGAVDAGETDAGMGCGLIGSACQAQNECPGLTCEPNLGICVPIESCGGFANAQCPAERPICLFFRSADFGPCFTAEEADCACATAPPGALVCPP